MRTFVTQRLEKLRVFLAVHVDGDINHFQIARPLLTSDGVDTARASRHNELPEDIDKIWIVVGLNQNTRSISTRLQGARFKGRNFKAEVGAENYLACKHVEDRVYIYVPSRKWTHELRGIQIRIRVLDNTPLW